MDVIWYVRLARHGAVELHLKLAHIRARDGVCVLVDKARVEVGDACDLVACIARAAAQQLRFVLTQKDSGNRLRCVIEVQRIVLTEHLIEGGHCEVVLLDAGAEIVGDCRALDEDGLAVCTAQTIELKDLGIRGGQLQYFRRMREEGTA